MLSEVSVQFEPIINLNYSDNTVYSVSLSPGSYLLEVWGASGGDTLGGSNKNIPSLGGLGGYSRGILELETSSTIYSYVGGSGTSHSTDNPSISLGGFNGGGSSLERSSNGGGSGGGGSTDFCTIKSEFTNSNGHLIRSLESYQSRIIAAGGGGGSFAVNFDGSYRIVSYGGNGGGSKSSGSGYDQSYGCSNSMCNSLNQGNTDYISYNYVTSSDQFGTGIVGCFTSSNTLMNGAQPGFFGYGGKSIKSGANSGGGGGGGWFGGYSGTSGNNAMGTGGSGGSGYFHNGSNSNSNLDPMFILHNPILIPGNSTMPCIIESCSNEYGHHGDGFARITLLSNHSSIDKCNFSCLHFHNPVFLLFFMHICLFSCNYPDL